MNHKKQTSRRTIWRKELNGTFALKEWSRMLHKWWKNDILDKDAIRRGK